MAMVGMTTISCELQAPGLVRLGAAHDDAVVALLDDVQVHVGVGLLVWRQAAVALGVGHGAVGDEVVVLQVLDVPPEPRVILRAQLAWSIS